jgi:predicted MFS family arabinose efflux permease
MTATAKEKIFTPYQVFMIVILSILQFSIILDFMVLSPLGYLLMEKLKISPNQFALVVSVYALSAGISSFLSAGFADRFDRKKFLLFFYTGFILGTFFCAIAPDYYTLLVARVVTGLFGGVIGSVNLAIMTDLFRMEVRGRVMGFTQMAFAASQVLGIPIGLILAIHFGWHSPFWMIGVFSALVAVVIVVYMKPVTAHLDKKTDKHPLHHLIHTLIRPDYLQTFLAMMLLATGGFMLMPFGSDYSTHNLGLSPEQLPVLYGVTGIFSIIFGPLIGKASDKVGKFRMFFIGSVITMVMVLIYTRLGITPLWMVITISVVMFVGITARIISVSSLITGVPEMHDRGAFMSINACMQQIAGAIASYCAGLIVFKEPNGNLDNYPTLGYVVSAAMIVTLVMMYFIDRMVKRKLAAKTV